MLDELNRQIIQASRTGDGDRLAELYLLAGREFIDSERINTGCFFLTQAYIFALEAGLESSREILSILIAHGRDIQPSQERT